MVKKFWLTIKPKEKKSLSRECTPDRTDSGGGGTKFKGTISCMMFPA